MLLFQCYLGNIPQCYVSRVSVFQVGYSSSAFESCLFLKTSLPRQVRIDMAGVEVNGSARSCDLATESHCSAG